MKSSALEVAEVPPAVVTVTSCVPAPAGEVTVMDPAASAVTVPAVLPNLTAVAFARLEPVTMTLVPPAAGPEVGLTAVTVGAAV